MLQVSASILLPVMQEMAAGLRDFNARVISGGGACLLCVKILPLVDRRCQTTRTGSDLCAVPDGGDSVVFAVKCSESDVFGTLP